MNIETDDNCKQEFENIKFRKIQARYIVYAIVNEKITIERIGKKQQTWQQFLDLLPQNEYRYAVFDFEFTNHDNMNITKMIFVNWCADAAPIKNKVLYATAKEAFKKYLDLLTKDYVISSKGDMTEKDMIKELEK